MNATRNAVLAMQNAVQELPSRQRESVSRMSQRIYSIVKCGGEDGLLALAVVTTWLADEDENAHSS